MTTTGLKLTKLHQVALAVTDLARSVEFYRDRVGLEFTMQFDPPGLAFFDLDGTRLMLDAIAEAAGHASPLYFWVDDMDTAVATLKGRGVAFEGDPHVINREPDGTEEWMAFFKDPDENVLALATKRSPSA
ncbi:MAG: VOC family protein [Chloroflexi bacterium]|nr:VOC family protein [Chloroflexota bacterium]MDA1147027.1 VOC family protein [Chloroflexota bacterium]